MDIALLGPGCHNCQTLEHRTRQAVAELGLSPNFSKVTDYAEIAAYVASGDPLDKAGAYAIQNPAFRPVARLQGCYANVMGLPLCHVTRCLRNLGVHPPRDVPTACQTHNAHLCPVHAQILNDQ